jgi:GNAT superfamily N-acetyltransferase
MWISALRPSSNREAPAGSRVIDEAALLRLHIDVLFVRNEDGRLVAVNEPDGDRPPLVFLARGRSSCRIAFRDDVSEDSAGAWTEIAGRLRPWEDGPPDSSLYEELRSAVSAVASVNEFSGGPAFRFDPAVRYRPEVCVTPVDDGSDHLLEPFFPYTRSVLAERRPVVGVVVDGAVVSACYSARRGTEACEAGVDTQKEYRGRGYGAAVVAAWRDAVGHEGLVPLYSTSWDNAASLGIARKLELVPYADTLSIS